MSFQKAQPKHHEPMKTPKGTLLPLLDLRGKPYLQVPHRIVWFREDHPDWVMEATFPNLNDEFAMARAEIRDAEGKVKAVAHKVEHKAHFADYIEKSETSAIGRALAMIGYGTQFAPELEEDDRLVDAPVSSVKKESADKQKMLKNEATVSESQIKRMFSIMNEKKIQNQELKEVIKVLYGKESSKDLKRWEYDELTEKMSSLSRDAFFVWYVEKTSEANQ